MYNEPMEKILVTGGAGFIGSHFVDQCLNKGIEVINYDAMKIGSLPEHGPDKIHPLYGFEKIDIIKDLYQLPNNIDTIVHFAAETHVDRSLSDPNSFVESNIIGTYNLIQKCIGSNIRFHLVSTDEVYGDTINNIEPSKEEDQIISSSPYSASKAASEQLVMAWGRTYDLNHTITRGCNTIGARQNKEKLFPKFIYNASHGIPLPVYGNGTAIRQYMDVTDHADGIFNVVTKAESGKIYNLCSDFSASINDIVDFIRQYYPNLTTTDKENRAGHDLKYTISNFKITNDLGWQAKFKGINILENAYKCLN